MGFNWDEAPTSIPGSKTIVKSFDSKPTLVPRGYIRIHFVFVLNSKNGLFKICIVFSSERLTSGFAFFQPAVERI